jgi:vitamin B12 transporter
MSLCMPRGARSSVLALVPVLFSAAAAPAHADAIAGSGAQAVVVTGTRTPQRVDQALAEISVIDRAALERAAGRTLPELLAQTPGLQFWSNGGLGKTSSVSIRGLEGRHVLLLIDGVRYGSVTVGAANFDNLPLEAIERIEIVRGPLSALYGSDAVGGVVQVFTRRGTQAAAGWAANANAGGGTEGYAQAGGGVRVGAGPFDGALQLQRVRTRGFSATNANVPFGSFNPDDDGFAQTSASVQLGLQLPGSWRAGLSALRSSGKSAYDDGPGVDARSANRSRVLALQVGGPVLAAWRTQLRIAQAVDEADTVSSASAFAALGVVSSDQRQLSWENTLATPVGSLLLLADRVEQVVSRPGAPFAVSERSTTGIALGLNGQAGAHHWQAALRRDRNTQFGSRSTGTLGYGHDLTPQLRAAVAFGTSFVMPSFNQLYFPNFGNPNLLPEEGRHREWSLRWADGGQQLRAAYFENRIRGYISSGPLPSNIPRTRADGLSLSWQASVANWLLSASGEALQARNDTAGSANFGRVLPRRAEQSMRAAADVALVGWRLGGTLQHVGPRFDNAANTTPVAAFTTLDLRADWQLAPAWTLGFKLNNAADIRYETVYGYNQPGREGFVTLRWAGR